MATTDVVIVSYNSAEHLRACVGPLAGLEAVNVIVVDNASTDESLGTLAGLPVTTIPRSTNDGFATGCNAGWQAGSAPFVLFLNPDATIEERSLFRLVEVLEREPRAGIAAPRIERADGSLVYSLRRFPRLRSTYARALFLHRLWPHARWTDEVVRDERHYTREGEFEWVSGAGLLIRRTLLAEIGGFDERFFLYCEDKDLCRRVWDAGFTVKYEPNALVRHVGGASTAPNRFQAVLASSRTLYAAKHSSRLGAVLERFGVALSAASHALLGRRQTRLDHFRALLTTLGRSPRRPGGS